MKELRTDRYKLKEIFPDKAKAYAQKLKIKAGELEYVRKGIPIDPKDIEIKEGERAAIRLVTTPHLDRDGEILIPGGAILDDFRQSPSVMYAHDYRGLPIGSDQWIKQVKQGILAKTVYAKHQFAEDVYQCVKDRHLNSNSVGFIPIEVVSQEDKKQFELTQGILEKDYGISRDESVKAKNIYTKWIMLEHSDVPIASNAQSLNLAVSKGELVIHSDRLKKDLEIEVVKDLEIEVIKNDDRNCEHDWIEAMAKNEFYLCSKCGATGEKTMLPSFGNLPEKELIITKPETTDQYHRIPVNPGCEITATITISAAGGIKALYCGKVKKIHTYLFDVKKWTMAEAQAWVREHKDFVPPEEEMDMEEEIIGKEVPECKECEEEHNEMVDYLNLETAIKDLTGQIAELKEGRVLNTKNRTLVKETIDVLTTLKERLEELYNATEPPAREEGKEPKEGEFILEKNGKRDNLDDSIASIVEKVLGGDRFSKMINDAIMEALNVGFKKKLGKVE